MAILTPYMQNPLVDLLRQHERLSPGEQKIALHLWTRIMEGGGTPVELTIADIALETGLGRRTVQKHRAALCRHGAIRLLSKGRERSRFALPEGVALCEGEITKPPSPMPEVQARTVEEEIFTFIAEILGGRPDRVFVDEAQQLAGGQTQLLECLRLLNQVRTRNTPASLLAQISRLSYNLGFWRPGRS